MSKFHDNGGLLGFPIAEAVELGKKRRLERFERVIAALPERAARVVKNIPKSYLDRYLKARLGEASPRIAIKAKCEECCGYEDAQPRISDCRSLSCPLWAYRPYQNKIKSGA